MARSQVLIIALVVFVGTQACAPSEEPATTGPVSEGIGCSDWTRAEEFGALDHEVISEASGLAISSRFPNRLYHINDSGDSGRFFITDTKGDATRIVRIADFEPRDTEDLSLGACPSGNGSCLFIADLGDNAAVRSDLEIVVIEEEDEFPSTVSPVHRFRVRYPDGPHDAEGMAVHPNGDIYVITKRANYLLRSAGASDLYRIPRAAWADSSGGVVEGTLVGKMDLTAISDDRFSGSLPTALDIIEDGSRFIVLTYTDAFEFYFDLSATPLPPTPEMVPGRDYALIELVPLSQQEAVAYIPGSGDFLYDTEREGSEPGSDTTGRARIMRVLCLD